MFILHPKLAADTHLIGDLSLCRVLLMNNRHFPWLILVPRREGMRELFDLSELDYHTALEETRHVASQLHIMTCADKINIAALGNMVEQLHIHIVARFKDDAAWPQPVWNSPVAPEPYPVDKLASEIEKIRLILGFTNITKM